jgi:hypothetical protein
MDEEIGIFVGTEEKIKIGNDDQLYIRLNLLFSRRNGHTGFRATGICVPRLESRASNL